MSRFSLVPCFASLAVVAACTSATGPRGDLTEFTLVQSADSIPLHFGKLVRVGDAGFFQLNEVTDSRCPVGVQCVWAGDGVATILVHPPCYLANCKAASVVLQLHTGLEPRAGSAWGYRVTLVALTPHPVASQPFDPSRYVAWVRVAKAA